MSHSTSNAPSSDTPSSDATSSDATGSDATSSDATGSDATSPPEQQTSLTVESCKNLPPARLPEYIKTQHSRLYNIIWRDSPPKNVLMVKKPWDSTVREAMIQLIDHLHASYPSVNVVVNEDVADELVNEVTALNKLLDKSINHVIYTGNNKDIIGKIDLMITLGGDGTILRGVSLFSNVRVPPVLSFAMGTLGFLLPFDYKNSMKCFKTVYEGRSKALYRNRLECHVLRNQDKDSRDGRDSKDGKDSRDSRDGKDSKDSKDIALKNEELATKKDKREMVHAMNDITIHRGSSPNLTSIDIYIDDEFFTTTYADGLIFSTPTGSTAYSLSAGGSITHPAVPCILLTPICPRSLSFRPLILPSTSDIMIKLSEHNRSETIELTIDGISQEDLRPGDELHITSEAAAIRHQQQQHLDEEMVNGSKYSNNRDGIWCVATNPNQWAKDLNSLLGFNSSFRDQRDKKSHL
ncbi:POS5 [Candida oxycetoniae]|uniref:POS5 n=1 Tax=Candida oxycetoniae TaxID=497107 RepID=A0AAI9SZI1_9ASCO|nr:POS5 [Candida oxycetoniae]KAI3405675.2 POS5 [Candida oxycetoniae]